MDTSAIKAAYDRRFDEISAAIFLALPPNGQIVSVNSEAEELTGYEAHELEKMTFSDLFCEDDKTRIDSIFKMQLNSSFRKLFEYNVIIQKRSKRKIIVDMGFRRTNLDQSQLFIFTLQDITDLKNSEQRVIRANDYINSIINSVIETLLVVDSKGNIQTANHAALSLLEYTEKELIGEPISKIFDPSPENPISPKSLMNPGGIAEIESRFLTKSQKVIPILLSASSMKGLQKDSLDDKGTSTVIVAMDITERKKTEALLAAQQMMMVHTSKMSALGEMASGVAHEINNPLLVIKGHCEIMNMSFNEKNADLKTIQHAVSQIDTMSARIEKIVKGLSSFSRDQSHDPFFPSGLMVIINDTLTFCDKKFRNKGIKLELPDIPQTLTVECRPTQISQVLLNLLNNAFDVVSVLPDPWIKIEFSPASHCVTLSVSNSGPKIPAEISEKIFQPFFTTKPVGKGTGLGLSISRAIIEDHGGKLILDQTCENTKFIITLPVNRKK